MRILRWLAAALSVYSRIPMPHLDWTEDDMSHSLIFFPAVGVIIGMIVIIINGIMPFASVPAAVRIILTLLIPLIVTGGFHADGLMDTSDALHSYASKERKLEIMKDPHVGAFGIISLMKWMLIYAAAVTSILLSGKTDIKVLAVWGLGFVVSRCLSGITSLIFKKAKMNGMLYEETKKSRNMILAVLAFELVTAGALMVCLNAVCAAAVIAAYLLFTAAYRVRSYKEFGGVTGDTAGYFLTAGEILSTAVLALVLLV